MTEIPCGKQGCTDTATHGIKLCVPCVGLALAQHRPLELFIGLMLCQTHAANADVKQFFAARPQTLALREPPPASPLKPIFQHAAGAQGREPDYNRAFIAPIALDSPEWKDFMAKTQMANPQGNA